MRIIGYTLTWFLVNAMKLMSTIMCNLIVLKKIHKLQRRCLGLNDQSPFLGWILVVVQMESVSLGPGGVLHLYKSLLKLVSALPVLEFIL